MAARTNVCSGSGHDSAPLRLYKQSLGQLELELEQAQFLVFSGDRNATMIAFKVPVRKEGPLTRYSRRKGSSRYWESSKRTVGGDSSDPIMLKTYSVFATGLKKKAI